MQEFKCVTDAIAEIKSALEEIQQSLSEAYERAVLLYLGVDDENSWTGEAQRAALAFLSLTLQYHGALSNPDGGPVCQASEGLQKYLDSDSTFYDEWEEYQKIRTI